MNNTQSQDRPTMVVASLETILEREQKLLKALTLTLIVGSFFNLITDQLLSSSPNFFSLLMEFGGIVVATLAYIFSRSLRTVRIGSWLVVGYIVVFQDVILFSYGYYNTSVYLLSFVALILSIFLLPRLVTIGFVAFSVVNIVLSVYLFPANAGNQEKLIVSTVNITVIWTATLIAIASVGLTFVGQLKRIYQKALDQNNNLQLLLAEAERNRQFGEATSFNLNDIAIKLVTASHEQAGNSRIYASAVVQLTAFLSELSETARNIANNTTRLNEASNLVLKSAHQAEEASKAVVEVGTRGLNTVNRVIASNQRIIDLYDNMLRNLEDLNDYSAEIKKIVALLSGISSETHLLSLNAAIEAAGAGQEGERFRVVAGEIRNLANRSINASQLVAQILGQVQQSIQNVVVAAKEGQEETGEAGIVTSQSRDVIRELDNAIKYSSQEASLIHNVLSQVVQLHQQIISAVDQQYNATEQAVKTVEGISNLAQNTATDSLKISNTARDLETVSLDLVKILVTSK